MALLKQFDVGGKSGLLLVVSAVGAAVITGLAVLESMIGRGILNAPAILSWITVVMCILQHYVAGPAFRELGRLREELEALKKD